MAIRESLQAFWTTVEPYTSRLAVWRGYEAELETLAIYGIGIAVYTALVFTFYQSISKRTPLHLKLSDRPGWTGRVSTFLEKAFVFPITSFLYFGVLAAALFLLVKPGPTTQNLLLISMAVVVGVRVTVYLSEVMSNDLAKLVPLSLLGVTLVDPGYLTLQLAWTRIGEAVDLWPLLGRFFLLFIALEVVFGVGRRSVVAVANRITGRKDRTAASERMFSVDVKDARPEEESTVKRS